MRNRPCSGATRSAATIAVATVLGMILVFASVAGDRAAGAQGVGVDFGDAPDSYSTLLASDGARHTIGGALTLGATIDAEADGQPDASAAGDDLAALDDEDGVTLPATFTATQTANISVGVSAAGQLNAWIDWNGNGDWSDPGEQIFTDQSVVAGANALMVPVPATATPGTTFARFRVSTAGADTPTGLAADGEVEDYAIVVAAAPAPEFDFGDAPDTYGTLLASNGAQHTIGAALTLGATIDAEADGQPDAAAAGDDLAAADDEDGVTLPATFTATQTANISVSVSAAGLLNAWIDWNADGDFTDPGEQIFTDQPVVGGANPLTVPVPATATTGTTYARFRLSTAGGDTPTGLAADGEVEDYLVAIDPAPPVTTGTITIIEDTVPDGPQDFTYAATSPSPPNQADLTPAFLLDDDADPTLPNTRTFTAELAGTHTVAQTAVAGFTTTVTCTDPDNGSTTAGLVATIDLDAGETVTCTFTNTAIATPNPAATPTTVGGGTGDTGSRPVAPSTAATQPAAPSPAAPAPVVGATVAGETAPLALTGSQTTLLVQLGLLLTGAGALIAGADHRRRIRNRD